VLPAQQAAPAEPHRLQIPELVVEVSHTAPASVQAALPVLVAQQASPSLPHRVQR
jgi:hypothetical protein